MKNLWERTVSNNGELLLIIILTIILVKLADVAGRMNIGVYN